MANKFKLPQRHIKVQVDFYDDEQKKKLLDYPTCERIKEIVKSGIEVPIVEFLTYYLFYRKRPGMPGYRNYEDLGRKIGKSLSDLEDFINFNGISISTPHNIGEQDIHITERIGESIGLSVMNRIHDISEADWDRIKRGKGVRIFDYAIASDGTSIIQVEAKGSSINNNDLRLSTVRNHKSSIIGKKTEIAELEAINKYPYPANLRYGTITILDNRKDSTVKCLLVDPEPEYENTPPAKLRLINRMRFLRDWITFISPQSQFAAALSTRVAALEALSDPFELDGIPLRKGTGEPFEIIPTPAGFGDTLGFLMNKSRVSDGPSCGIVTKISPTALFYLGIRDNIAVHAAEQSFREILTYKAEIGTVYKTVRCVVHSNRFKRMGLPKWLVEGVQEGPDYISFMLKGELYYNRDGLVFGVLPLET
jgi:hypothetical protein